MLIKTILNHCQHFKGFVYTKVRKVKKYGKSWIEVDIRSRSGCRPQCSQCQQPGSCYDTSSEVRRFEFVPLWGYRTFFLYRMRRVDCKKCGIKVESVPWGHGKHQLTKTYMQVLASWCKGLSWKEVAGRFQTSWEKVFHSVEYVVEWGLSHRSLDGITAIGIDEVLWHRGHKYLTVVYQINSQSVRLLWVGRDRTVKTLLRFFRFLGKERTALLQNICSDMWKPYLKVIKKKAPLAIHILDRFHIVSMLNKAIDEIRAGEYGKMKKDGHEPILKRSRWCLLKRPENLTDKQDLKLKTLLSYNLKSVRAYLLKEDFQGFWEYVSPTWAGKFLDEWCRTVMRSRLDPMKKVAKTIRRHRDLILNWFRAKKEFSCGVVEGLNNKIKLTFRKAYGFKSNKCTEIALYHALGKLPEPPMTHRFC